MGGSNNRFRGRHLAAVLGAFTLALSGAVGAALPASAVDAYGNIDTNKTGSILIHKHVYQSGTSETATPDGKTDISSAGVMGVKFTAYPITSLSLTVAASWSTLATLAVPSTACDTLPPTALSGQALGAGLVSSATLADGSASITAPVAAYLVCETTTPSTVVDKAQPFVVTVPYPYKRASGTPTESWLYNVNVYPKNGLASISKTVTTQASLGLGSLSAFPVTTDIPTIASNANFTHYWVQDPMDARFTGATVASVTVGVTTVPAANYLLTTAGNVVTLQFTNAGLTWLKGQGGGKLVTTFTGTATTLGTGVINNVASFSAATKVGSVPVTPDDPSNPAYTASVSASVTQNWGDLAVHKVDAGELTTGVEGAVFEVYAAADPYAATCAPVPTADPAISVNGQTKFTTSPTGVLSIAGLFISDGENGPKAALQRCYVLKEFAAPAGFILPTGGTELTAVAAKTGVTNISVGYDKSIPNTRIGGLVLPMTGSNGIVVLSVAGLALIAAGLVLAFLARRRKQTA